MPSGDSENIVEEAPDDIETEIDCCLCHKLNNMARWLTHNYVDRPAIFLIVFAAFFIVVLVLTFAFNLFRMNPPTDRDYLVWDNIMTYKLD